MEVQQQPSSNAHTAKEAQIASPFQIVIVTNILECQHVAHRCSRHLSSIIIWRSVEQLRPGAFELQRNFNIAPVPDNNIQTIGENRSRKAKLKLFRQFGGSIQ